MSRLAATLLSTLLLALAIPCSAQLGVILAILSGQPLALGVWAFSLLGTFLLVGWLSARLLPGEAASFHMELPPMRLPRVGNVVMKTYSRMQWYFLEVLPLFLLASVLLWGMDLTGMIRWVVAGLTPIVGAIGLLALPRDPERPFREMLILGRRFDDWLNLFGRVEPRSRHTGRAGGTVDSWFTRLEAIVVEQHRRGGITATAKEAIDRGLDSVQLAARRSGPKE